MCYNFISTINKRKTFKKFAILHDMEILVFYSSNTRIGMIIYKPNRIQQTLEK